MSEKGFRLSDAGCSSAIARVLLLPVAFPPHHSFLVAGAVATGNVALDPNGSPTAQVALSTSADGHHTDHSLMLSGASLAVPPVVGIFTLPARHIVGGLVQGAVKG